MLVSIRSVLVVSKPSSQHLIQGFPTLPRPRRISLLPHIHLAATEVGLEISLHPRLLELKHIFLPPKLELSLLLYFSGLFLTQFASFFTRNMPKQSPPGAPSVAEHHEKMLHK